MPRTAVLTGRQRRVQRALEVAPGVLTWGILLAPVVGSLFFAPYVAVAIFTLDVYWVVRTFSVVIAIRKTYRRMRGELRIDWWQRCLEIPLRPVRPDPRRIVHAVLIPTYTEPYGVLRETVRPFQVFTVALVPLPERVTADVGTVTASLAVASTTWSSAREPAGSEMVGFSTVTVTG